MEVNGPLFHKVKNVQFNLGLKKQICYTNKGDCPSTVSQKEKKGGGMKKTNEDLMNKRISISKLLKILKEFDESHGSYPNHLYEGKAVAKAILQQLRKTDEEKVNVIKFVNREWESVRKAIRKEVQSCSLIWRR